MNIFDIGLIKLRINRVFYLVAALILLGFACINCYALTTYTSVEDYIRAQKTIRIVVDDGPGYGNQAASYNVVTRLRQLGFKGSIEFIYPGMVTDKIITLFNLPKNIDDVYDDVTQNIRFIKMKYFVTQNQNHDVYQINLGVTGGFFPPPCEVAEADGANVHDDGSMFCENKANFSNTKQFIQLTPYYFGPIDSARTTTAIYANNVKGEYDQPGSGEKFVYAPFISLADTKAYLENDPLGQALMKSKPALKTFIEAMENQSVNILPVYGKTVMDKSYASDDLDTFPHNILQIITAARYVQIHGPDHFNNPVIIPVFYDYNKEADSLMSMLHSDNWGEYENSNSDNIRKLIKDLTLQDIFSVADVNDPHTVETIQSLQPGHILLLSLGPLPKTVFDGIYNYTGPNVWPQIREGANSFNTLVQTGRPHFRCQSSIERNGWDIGYKLVSDVNLRNQLQNFYNNFCNSKGWSEMSKVDKMIFSLTIEANDLSSPLSSYFASLKEQALDPMNDRLYFALTEITDRANSDIAKK